MRVFQRKESTFEQALPFVMGAAGGLMIGFVVAGRSARRYQPYGADVYDRTRPSDLRTQPARRHQFVGEQAELTELEDAVLDTFRADEVLSERGIDVGAISRGIVELSGSVWTESDADRAVQVAGSVPGVETVVDRLEIDEEERHLQGTRQRFDSDDPSLTETHWHGRGVGMGRMRQGGETEPDRPDDSQKLQERALREADRDEWTSEDLAAANPRKAERPEAPHPEKNPDFSADELGNQDPDDALERQPQALNPSARVGEGPKPGTELRLEQADLPVKPHGASPN